MRGTSNVRESNIQLILHINVYLPSAKWQGSFLASFLKLVSSEFVSRDRILAGRSLNGVLYPLTLSGNRSASTGNIPVPHQSTNLGPSSSSILLNSTSSSVRVSRSVVPVWLSGTECCVVGGVTASNGVDMLGIKTVLLVTFSVRDGGPEEHL